MYLLRHGESEANAAKVFSGRRGDPALTEAGRRQASAQADVLAASGISTIWSSPLRRARQTADEVSRRTSHSITS